MIKDDSKRDEFLREPRTGVLSTLGKSGTVHAVPVIYLWQDGTFRILTDRISQKRKNIDRSGRASLCIPGEGGRYVTAEGPVAIEDPVSYDQRLALHTHYRGLEAATKVVADGAHERMITLVLTPERWL